MAAQMLGSTTATGTMPRVNLLPPEIGERVALRRAQAAMVATGIAAVAVVGALYVHQSSKVAEANTTMEQANTTNTKLTKEVAALKSVSDTYAAVDASKATLATAMQNDIVWSGYLHNLTLTIPENVWITSFTADVQTDAVGSSAARKTVLDPGLGTVTVAGTSLEKHDIAAWLESLATQKGYANPYVTQIDKAKIGTHDVYDFTSTVNLTPKAVSTRYAKGITR